MNAFLDQDYFDWLYKQVEIFGRSYRELLCILYTHEFVWLIPNDDNRVEDGKELRHEYVEAEGIFIAPRDLIWMDLGCSFLEFLIALSRRASFETGLDQTVWFWELMENIGLSSFHDNAKMDRKEVEEAIKRVVWRTYEPDGSGGLFPLSDPHQDQREVEVWYQLSSYILERSLV